MVGGVDGEICQLMSLFAGGARTMDDGDIVHSHAFPTRGGKATVPGVVVGRHLELKQHVGSVWVTRNAAGDVVGNRHPSKRLIGVIRSLIGKPVARHPGNARHGGPRCAVVHAHVDQQVVRERALEVPVGPEFKPHRARQAREVRRQVQPPIGVVGVIAAHVAVEPCARDIAEVGERVVVNEPTVAQARRA